MSDSLFLILVALAGAGVASFFGWHLVRSLRMGVTWSSEYPHIRYKRADEPILYWTMMALNLALMLIIAALPAFITLVLLFPDCTNVPLINQILVC